MTTLASDLIAETKRHLFSGQNEELNRLDGSITAGATSILFKYDVGGIQRGATISIDLEEIQVWEVSGKTATVVQRGVNGSTAASHSDLASVAVKPKFSDFRILTAINHDLRDLSAPDNGLYQIKTVELTYNSAVQGYDLTSVASDLIGILEVRFDLVGPEKTFPKIDKFALLRNMNTTNFASGSALVLYQSAYPGRAIRVRYKGTFTPMTATTDNAVTAAGLTDTMVDLPPLGAAIRLVAPRDVKRAFSETQGEPRRADEVRVGDGATSMRGMMLLRSQRINAERARLDSFYPYTMVG